MTVLRNVLSFVLLLGFVVAYEVLSEYGQSDYDIVMERAQISWFNHSVYRYATAAFVPYNRTQRAINYTFYLRYDLTRDLTVRAQVNKFMSNEYRYFPISGGANLCEHFDKNSFKVKDLLKGKSNAISCPWTKGAYYGYNILPDFALFPPLIPRGRYMIEIKIYHKSDYLGHGEVYGEVKDKPIKWK